MAVANDDAAMPETNDDSEILVILIDTDQSLRYNASEADAHPTPLQQIVAFMNCFLLLNAANELAVFAIHASQSKLLFRHDNEHKDRQGGSLIGRDVYQNISEALDALPANNDREPSLSAALSRALCYLNAHDKSSATQMMRPKSGHVLIVQMTPDVPRQYIPLMNCIFAAQRKSVLIDSLCLDQTDSSFLQQASHLTGGIYVRPQDTSSLLQYLTTYFSTNAKIREHFQLDRNESVNFTASCFCHEQSINLGFACSVCLALFCCNSKACSVCGEYFWS